MNNKEKITFRPLTEHDLPLLHWWFQKPHVKKWYANGQFFSLDMIERKYLARINNSEIANYIIDANAAPIGYIQFYKVERFLPEGIGDYNHPLFHKYHPAQLVGIDLFIAENDYLHKGYGCQIIDDFIIKYLIGKFQAVVVDPKKDNMIAISFFRKNGFTSIQIEEDNEHIIMLREIG